MTTTVSTTKERKSMLYIALLSNAIFSGLAAIDLIVFAGPIADWIGVPNPTVLQIVGLALIPWAVVVYRETQAAKIRKSFAQFVIVGDLLWVVGSAVLLLSDLVSFTTAGMWLIAIVADIVLGFAVWQYFGLRKMER